ncbi:molybdenum cofactor sulfurylase [Cognatiyoonia koreensis]|uniref:Molybdenum cofactor sulfurylase n=1 Tax=Cognatiyoonia koreensis TaxID=364200 RepID=A0A1I0QKD6_9RHOB|nr:xanthine dehydrogenase accessory protein XdhC [Cognatiyoonia koreensis]SEW27161.1 molybdenum cofactor sulfurylase [Cognatiyoonia koreensis]
MKHVRVTVTKTAGSVPRDSGTQMMVFADHIEGTIGGGALEWQAMSLARAMLQKGQTTATQTIPLGPALGQCCGGSVTLTFDADAPMTVDIARPVWIFGAGHVGRALVGVLAPLPDIAVTWIDTEETRFPKVPDSVDQLVASDPVAVVKHAPANAEHLILTYSHDLDLALCHAILSRSFGAVGLIGSATKWARFQKRLATLGHPAEQIARIACPIGDPTLGKHPQAIAIGVATALLGGFDRQRDKGTG